MMQHALPEGWTETTLDQLIESLQTGSRPPGGVRHIANGIPSIGGEHLNGNGGFRFDNLKYVPHDFYAHMMRGRIQSDDVLIVKDGATTGKVALVRSDFPHQLAVVNEHVYICRPLLGIYPPFLFYYLFAGEGQKNILENFQGSAQGGINQGFAPGTSVRLAPFAEQKRIVSQVEALLSRNNAARDKLAKGAAILKRFRQSVLAAACSGRLTADWRETQTDLEPASVLLERIRQERKAKLGAKYREPSLPDVSDLPELPEGWEWATVEQIATIKGGIQKQPTRTPKNNAYPYLRVANVLRGRLDLKEIHRFELFHKELDTYRLEPNDLLVVEGNGSLTEIGRSAIWYGEITDCVHQNHIIRVRFVECLPQYVDYYWNSPQGMERVSNVAVTTAGLYSLSIGKVSVLPVPIPSLSEQAMVIKHVAALLQLADLIERRIVESSTCAERLTQAILTKAFLGELVPTEAELSRQAGREYESAETLLNRIHIQRTILKADLPRSRKQPVQKSNDSIMTYPLHELLADTFGSDAFTREDLETLCEQRNVDADKFVEDLFHLLEARLDGEQPVLKMTYIKETPTYQFQRIAEQRA